MEWEKIGKKVTTEGTVITYRGQDPTLTIESRKVEIPHASRSGTWTHTTFFVMVAGTPVQECMTLAAAKAYAEKMMGV